jgi:hypothetical protein
MKNSARFGTQCGFHTELTGQMQQQHVRIEQIKILLIRAADALDNRSRETHCELVQELRKAGR